MYFLAYVSKASKKLSVDDLRDILEKSRVKNERNDVTGLLLRRWDHFFQLLEGEKKDVLSIFQKIAKDPRHVEIRILFEVEIDGASRIFPFWNMGFIGGRLQAQELHDLMSTLDSIASAIPATTTSNSGNFKSGASKSPSPNGVPDTTAVGKKEREIILNLLKAFSNTLPTSAREILSKATQMVD